MVEDWLAAEELIVTRLKTEMPELKTVTTAAEIAAVEKMRQLAPAAIVIYDGDDVRQGPQAKPNRGQNEIVSQRWLVIIAVQNVADQRGGSGARRVAGPLISRAKRTLAGFDLGLPGVRPLQSASAPGPAFESGYGYFPLLFTAEVFT